MNKKVFDLDGWSAPNTTSSSTSSSTSSDSSTSSSTPYLSSTPHDTQQEVSLVARQIISLGIDITSGYNNWLRLGFALADGLNEAGRQTFHELSSMNSGYNHSECDRQYSACLKSRNGGVGIATFFHMAKEAGVDIRQNCSEMRQNGRVAPLAPLAPSANKNLKNKNNIDNQSFIKNDTSGLALGAMAQVAQVRQNVTPISTGYTFSDQLESSRLTPFLRDVFKMWTDTVDRDKMLLGILNVVSGLMGGSDAGRPGIYAIYDGRRIYAPLFNIVYGTAGSSKGDLVFCKHLARPVQREMRRRYEALKSQWETDFALWESKSKGKERQNRGAAPKEPPYQDPFMAGNSSSSAVYRALNDNGGWGIMFETEADTISAMLASDYGNYSDLLRRAFHHESVSMNRTTDKLHIAIDEPRLSVMLTCTPGQMPALFPSFENGLGSRFLFYGLPDVMPQFRNVFQSADTSLDDIFLKMGDELMPLYHALKSRSERPLQFVLSVVQQQTFMSHFGDILYEQLTILGADIKAFVYRLALSCFRYTMTLTLLRRLDEWRSSGESMHHGIFLDDEQAIVCHDDDFETALTIVDCLVNHTARVYAVMAKENDNPFNTSGTNVSDDTWRLYKALPTGRMRTKDFMDTAERIGIAKRTAQRMLNLMCNVHHLILPANRRGYYIKPQPDSADSSTTASSHPDK